MDQHLLKGVEIFAAGVHNEDTYTTGDLDEMVSAFDAVGFVPPITRGHIDPKNVGQPADGWVQRIYRTGQKLLADLMVPSDIYQAIKDRKFGHVSVEVFFDCKRAGQVFKRVLKCLALLGAETPACAGLEPLWTKLDGKDVPYHAYASPLSYEEVDGHHIHIPSVVDTATDRIIEQAHDYIEGLRTSIQTLDDIADVRKALDAQLARVAAYSARDNNNPQGDEMTSDVEAEINRRAQNLLAGNVCRSYGAAVQKVLNDDPELTHAYHVATVPAQYRGMQTSRNQVVDPGPEIHAKAQALIANGAVKGYGAAVKHVLATNPDLKNRYATFQAA